MQWWKNGSHHVLLKHLLYFILIVAVLEFWLEIDASWVRGLFEHDGFWLKLPTLPSSPFWNASFGQSFRTAQECMFLSFVVSPLWLVVLTPHVMLITVVDLLMQTHFNPSMPVSLKQWPLLHSNFDVEWTYWELNLCICFVFVHVWIELTWQLSMYVITI